MGMETLQPPLQPPPTRSKPDAAPDADWVAIRRDAWSGIESVHAHFEGHAYDPHDHDEMLVGVTQHGVQRFSCGRTVHTSIPGRSILIEPGAVHDGHAPVDGGFTYVMLYLPVPWMAGLMQRLELGKVSSVHHAFRSTLVDDVLLEKAIQAAFFALHYGHDRLERDQCLDRLVLRLSSHLATGNDAARGHPDTKMERARAYIHANFAHDIGLDELATYSGVDRFRFTREFKKAFGQTPHAYLVRLRLRVARQLLVAGKTPAVVAAQAGFSDQSHLGLWFRRAYRLTPAASQKHCTNLKD